MIELGHSDPLKPFLCEPDQAYEYLADRELGVALIELPPEIDPVGFIGELAVFAEQLPMWEHLGVTELLDQTMPTNLPILEQHIELQKKYKATTTALNSLVADHILPKCSGLAQERLAMVDFGWITREQLHRPSHIDTRSCITMWWGSTQAGFNIDLPKYGSTPIDTLQASHVLLMRQEEAGYLFSGLNEANGIRHSVDWDPTKSSPSRAVGITCLELTVSTACD